METAPPTVITTRGFAQRATFRDPRDASRDQVRAMARPARAGGGRGLPPWQGSVCAWPWTTCPTRRRRAVASWPARPRHRPLASRLLLPCPRASTSAPEAPLAELPPGSARPGNAPPRLSAEQPQPPSRTAGSPRDRRWPDGRGSRGPRGARAKRLADSRMKVAHRARSALALVVLLGSLGPREARAQATPPIDGEAHVQRGITLRREHRDADALVEFEQAYVLARNAENQAQFALAEMALGRWVDAELALVDALGAATDPVDLEKSRRLDRGSRVRPPPRGRAGDRCQRPGR